MNLNTETIKLAQEVSAEIDIPGITSIHLPKPVEQQEKPDTFGFVFLEDGSAGPFYTSLNKCLGELWRLYPDGKSCNTDCIELIEYFDGDSLALRSIALGAFNAMS